ncbi:MAG: hypothetical protein ABFR32_10185 [Bacteroidota bacterium]
MKKFKKGFLFLTIVLAISCSTKEELKEISGTYVFKNVGKHSFVVNANHIEATIKIIGANNGETIMAKNVHLDRNVEYTAIIGGESINNLKTALLNNLVTEYQASPGKVSNEIKNGIIRIDWVGFD